MKTCTLILFSLLGLFSLENAWAQYPNTTYGVGAGTSLTTGQGNVLIGYNSGYSTTTSVWNTMLGTGSGYYNTTGFANTCVGAFSGIGNTTGNSNVFIGMYSGYSNAASNNNIFIGYSSGFRNNGGQSNVYLGYRSGYSSQYSSNNVFIGHEAGTNDTYGDVNTFVGGESGKNNTTGHSNTYIGQQSGYSNSTGRYNTFVGRRGGYSNTTGWFNTFVGEYSGYANTTGERNTFLGEQSGRTNATGSGNVMLGYRAGYYETNSNRLYIANSSGMPLIYGNFSNRTVSIDYKYNGTTYKLYVPGQVYGTAFISPSDKRYKKNIEAVSTALEMIRTLRGVKYEYKDARTEGFPTGRQYGLIAQEVQEVLPELVVKDEEGYLAINYMGLIPVLIEAMKELTVGGDSTSYLKHIQTLQQENEAIKKELADIRTFLKAQGYTGVSSVGEMGTLYQNQPNPAGSHTSITYTLPASARQGAVYIYDLTGNLVKQIDNLSLGTGSVELARGSLPAGTYIYSLVADGKVIASKKLIFKP